MRLRTTLAIPYRYQTMNTTAFPATDMQQREETFRIISLTALLAGSLDIGTAIIKYYIETGNSPDFIFKYIASGVFGKEALTGGTLMITWGVVFHYVITFLFTIFLFLIYPAAYRLFKNRFVIAVLYGLFVWVIMNLAVIPLSKINKFPADATQNIVSIIILILFIGLPVALIAHRFYARKQAI